MRADYWLHPFLQRFRSAIQRACQHLQLLLRQRHIVRIDGFVDSRNHHRRIAGVLSRSINRVLEPRPVGQTIDEERPLGTDRIA